MDRVCAKPLTKGAPKKPACFPGFFWYLNDQAIAFIAAERRLL
jgi:hypothetical protein